ncbi:MAG: PD40 domain-containing protein [Bacteroidetes bacterium]|nr:PD40 domain-containing protein [Bacteroidota bacterium]
MKLRFIFLFCVVFELQSFAFKGKEYDKKFEQAEILYQGGNYYNALPVYLELFSADSSNSNISYKIGSCYLKSGYQHRNAIYYLKKAVVLATADYTANNRNEIRAPLKAYKLLGDAYHLNNDFDLAIDAYKKFQQALLTDKRSEKDVLKEVGRKIIMCNTAKTLVANPVDIKIVNLGKSINTEFPDYSPRLTADRNTMIFTSQRPGNTGGKTYDGGKYFEDIYMSVKKNGEWMPAQNMGWPVNTVGNEAAIGLSADGQQIFIYKDDLGNGNIYLSSLEGDKWSIPQRLNQNINSEWWEPCAFLSADGNALYFVSDRPGGFGGTDIYKSKKEENGDWGKAVNLGPTINSPYDEYSPFIHPDGVTLFFSSKGHQTMGGFDVFSSTTLLSDENAWLEPVNLGYPINSAGDDVFFMISPDKKNGYYSSFRDGGLGEKDNYMIIYPDPPESSIALFKGKMLDSKNNVVKNGVVTVTDHQTNVSGTHKSNSKTGEYLVVLPPGSYNISYEGDSLLFYSVDQYVAPENKYKEENRNVRLTNLAVGSKSTLNNIFFDFDDASLKRSSKSELDKLYKMLQHNPGLSVEVSGYADSKGTDEYNKKLSLERARSVANYLVRRGIKASRIIPVGVGKEMADSDDDTKETGLKPSGRRVEMKILNFEKN